jgi:hypothetical protein
VLLSLSCVFSALCAHKSDDQYATLCLQKVLREQKETVKALEAARGELRRGELAANK